MAAMRDPAVSPSVSTAIFFDSREAVDKAVADGIVAGGVELHPAADYGFMNRRQRIRPVRRHHTGLRAGGGAPGPAHRPRPVRRVAPLRELAAGLPRIPSNILAARLKELLAAGVLRRVPHPRVIVYELTPDGRELEPVVLALGARGSTWPPDGARASTRVTIDVAALMISGSGSSRRWDDTTEGRWVDQVGR